MKQQIRNMARCLKCGDIIESKSRHDFVRCKCGAIAVDGGNDYYKRVGNPKDFEELYIYKDLITGKDTIDHSTSI